MLLSRVDPKCQLKVRNVDPELIQSEELVSLITDERSFAVSPSNNITEQQSASPHVRAFVVHSPSNVQAEQMCISVTCQWSSTVSL